MDKKELFQRKKKELDAKKESKTYLGSDEDYIMTSPLSRFDDFTKWDIMGIESDLKHILYHKDLDRVYKGKAKKRYKQIINYIWERVREKEKADTKPVRKKTQAIDSVELWESLNPVNKESEK